MNPERSGRSARTVQLQLGGGLVLLLALGGCGGGTPSAPTPSVAAPAPAAAATPPPAAVKPGPVAMPKEPDPGPPLPPLTYDSKGRRDPFVVASIVINKPGLSVATLKLAGVIRGRTLLALVEAPDGLGYILKPGDTLGDGRVTEITPTIVTFAVAAKAGQSATTATLKLAQD